jgi:NIMA (never in mitosis gene a)-related kinase
MKFKKLQVLGKGTYGVVYLVYDKNTNKKYSLKKMIYNNKMVKSCQNELKILKMVKSKYIIEINNYFIKNGYFYIIMEYAIFGDLDKYIKEKKITNYKFNESKIKTIILSILNGIKALHDYDIIHRDLKPSNILICDNFNIKLADFGISKIVDNKYAVFTKIGTPYYMSPEMLNGKKYSYKIDYWALGCILYELLTFKRPFEGRSIHALCYNITKGKVNTNYIDRKYHKIINKLLNKNPNLRYGYNDVYNFFNNSNNQKVDLNIYNKKNNIYKKYRYNNLYDKYYNKYKTKYDLKKIEIEKNRNNKYKRQFLPKIKNNLL